MEDNVFKEFSQNPYAILVNSNAGLESIVKEGKKLAKASEVIVFLRDIKHIEKKLIPAYVNAYLRYKENAMHSNSLSIETILFVAGRMNIGNAIDSVSANSSKFIIFSSSKELAETIIKKFKLKKLKEIPLVLDPETASEVAMTAIRDDK